MGTLTIPKSPGSQVETLEYAQDAAVDGRIKRVLPEICRQAVACLPRKPLAVLLTGSFARGEGSAFLAGSRLKALSDMEFLVFCPSGSHLGRAQEALDVQARGLSKWLASQYIQCEPEFNAVGENYLSHLHPHLFGYELLTHGRTVWGDERIFARAPRFPASAIPHWDAWRLLNNRLLEQLQWAEVAEQRDPKWLQSALYHVLKCYLDLATVVLLFAGRYQSRYAERKTALQEWARSTSGPEEAFAPALVERVAACTEFKLHPHSSRLPWGRSLDGGPQELSGEVRRAMTGLVTLAHQVWRWAAITFTGLSHSNPPNDEALMRTVANAQPLPAKLRGWAKIALMPEVRKQPGFLGRMSRLWFQASPRYLIYSVASKLYFHLPEAVADEAPELGGEERRLPVCFAQHASELRPWWRLRANVLYGWKLFLRSHRA